MPLKYMGKLMNAMNTNEYVHLNPEILVLILICYGQLIDTSETAAQAFLTA